MRLVVYTDDLAVIAWSRKKKRMCMRAIEALSTVRRWMDETCLENPVSKPGAINLETGRKVYAPLHLGVDGEIVGVRRRVALSFKEHLVANAGRVIHQFQTDAQGGAGQLRGMKSAGICGKFGALRSQVYVGSGTCLYCAAT